MCSAGKGDGARLSPPPPLVDDDRTASPDDEL